MRGGVKSGNLSRYKASFWGRGEVGLRGLSGEYTIRRLGKFLESEGMENGGGGVIL